MLSPTGTGCSPVPCHVSAALFSFFQLPGTNLKPPNASTPRLLPCSHGTNCNLCAGAGLGLGGLCEPHKGTQGGHGSHGRGRGACAPKGTAGLVWCLDHFWITFPLAVFWPGHRRAVAGSEEGQDPRGDCCWNLDPAVLGAPLAWGRCCGTVPQVSCPSCPVLAVVSTGVLSQRVLSLLSVSAGCDFHELAPGLTPVCLHHARGAVVASGVVPGAAVGVAESVGSVPHLLPPSL